MNKNKSLFSIICLLLFLAHTWATQAIFTGFSLLYINLIISTALFVLGEFLGFDIVIHYKKSDESKNYFNCYLAFFLLLSLISYFFFFTIDLAPLIIGGYYLLLSNFRN